ncbi:hypothetical protein ACFL4E_01325 [Candidatus Omnitrophota bacterium]
MKIALLGAWNTDSGASIHAELVGRAWVEKGIDLQVFTFYRHSFHGTAITKTTEEEESYVNRCFTVYSAPHPELKTKPILDADFDIFVAEDLGMVPMNDLLKIFPEIKKKAKTVNVIHDGALSDKPEFFKFNWDYNVCFDDRYYNLLRPAYPEGKLGMIPYPAAPYNPGDMMQAREELGLPKDKKVVLLFGAAAEHAINTTLALDRLADKYDICLVLVTEIERVLEAFERIIPRVSFDFRIVEQSPDMELLTKYLYASDCMVYNKHSKPTVVLASTVFQCMGSGCPIISLDSNFVYNFHREVLKYKNFYELEDIMVDVFEKGEKFQKQQQAVKDYLEDYSAEPIADRFLKLFETLKRKR